MMITPKVSVIVPIYNVQAYIRRCVSSLLMQTLHDLEYIFVNDASPDNSIDELKDVLSDFTWRNSQVKIIEHECNKGLPAARNTGLKVATGEYIYHCDSDDYLELDMLEILYNQARAVDADFIYCDFYLKYDYKERYMQQLESRTVDELLENMLVGSLKYNVWNKLIRRRVYIDNDITFPDGHSMGEDMTILCLASCAKGVTCVQHPLYHYVRSNTEAMTQKFSYKNIDDIKFNLERTMIFFDNHGVGFHEARKFFKLNVKLPLLITDDWNSYRCWYELYPELNDLSGLNKRQPLRTRLIQKMAAKKFYIGIWLYYQIVYCFLYKILFR